MTVIKDTRASCAATLDECAHGHIGTITYNPLMYYRNMFTLQEGKSWRDGRRPGDELKGGPDRFHVFSFLYNCLFC